MGMEVEQATKGLNGDKDSWEKILTDKESLVDVFDGGIGTLREFAQETAIIEEVATKYFGDGENDLSMRDIG
jgi:hypothetical protein